LKVHHPLKVSYLDGNRFQCMVLAGCMEMMAHEKGLNRINVFPIPDKDTGSNLKETVGPLFHSFPVYEPEIGKAGRQMSETAVRSAMGYSGILFSQFLLGLSEYLEHRVRTTPTELVPALAAGYDKALKAVERPVEGTILSVWREWIEEIKEGYPLERDFSDFLRRSHRIARRALEKTPEQLDVLREHRVVDAGGKAFVLFLEGILRYLGSGDRRFLFKGKRKPRKGITTNEVEHPFCAECCIRGPRLDRKGLIESLGGGQNPEFLFFGSARLAKIHIPTRDPESVFARASRFGTVSARKVFDRKKEVDEKAKRPLCLVTDTTCDLSEDHIQLNPIYFVPIKVQYGEVLYTDRVDIIPEEFYALLKDSTALPHTSQPSFMDFTRTYEHLLRHFRSIVSVHISQGLSGTFQTAVRSARQVSPASILLVDSRSLSVGLGLVLLEGFSAIAEAENPGVVKKRLEKSAEEASLFIGLPTLKFLVKGGRITRTKGFLARLLGILPVLSLDREGKLAPVDKARGKNRLEQRIIRLVAERIRKEEREFRVAVAHTDAEETAQRIAREIESAAGIKPEMVMNASPVLGAHAGPGAFGVAALPRGDGIPQLPETG